MRILPPPSKSVRIIRVFQHLSRIMHGLEGRILAQNAIVLHLYTPEGQRDMGKEMKFLNIAMALKHQVSVFERGEVFMTRHYSDSCHYDADFTYQVMIPQLLLFCILPCINRTSRLSGKFVCLVFEWPRV
jgi:hypothetical protein